MWDEQREILDCLKRELDICVKNIVPSQNTAFDPRLKQFAGQLGWQVAHSDSKVWTSLPPKTLRRNCIFISSSSLSESTKQTLNGERSTPPPPPPPPPLPEETTRDKKQRGCLRGTFYFGGRGEVVWEFCFRYDVFFNPLMPLGICFRLFHWMCLNIIFGSGRVHEFRSVQRSIYIFTMVTVVLS